MEISFKTPELSDGQAVRDIITKSDCRFCEFTFGNIYCWGRYYNTQIAICDDVLVTGNPQKKHFSFPKGIGDRLCVLKNLIDSGADRFYSLSADESEFINAHFNGMFEISEYNFDYIYNSDKLRTLSGKKLASKRNHINAFLSDGEWSVREIKPDDCDTLLEFNDKWCKNKCDFQNSMLEKEMCAAKCGISNFEQLNYSGIMLFKNGKLTAYSFGEPINADTFCVHVEKADMSVRGAYQMINREFARAFCENYAFVNREDDAGDQGLRQAKLSYYPTDVGKKFIAKRKQL